MSSFHNIHLPKVKIIIISLKLSNCVVPFYTTSQNVQVIIKKLSYQYMLGPNGFLIRNTDIYCNFSIYHITFNEYSTKTIYYQILTYSLIVRIQVRLCRVLDPVKSQFAFYELLRKVFPFKLMHNFSHTFISLTCANELNPYEYSKASL